MAANPQPFTTLTILSLLTLNSSNISFSSTPFLFSKSQPSVSQWMGHFQGKFQSVFSRKWSIKCFPQRTKTKAWKMISPIPSAHCFQVQVLWVKFFGYIYVLFVYIKWWDKRFFFLFLPFCVCETFSPSLLCFPFFLIIFYFF